MTDRCGTPTMAASEAPAVGWAFRRGAARRPTRTEGAIIAKVRALCAKVTAIPCADPFGERAAVDFGAD